MYILGKPPITVFLAGSV